MVRLVHYLTLAAVLAGAGTAGAFVPGQAQCAPAAMDPAEGLSAYEVQTPAEGYALYWGLVADVPSQVTRLVLEMCPTGDRVEATFAPSADPKAPWAAFEGFRTQLDAAINSDVEYSFADLANMARDAGGEGRITRVDYTSCGCRLAGGV